MIKLLLQSILVPFPYLPIEMKCFQQQQQRLRRENSEEMVEILHKSFK